MRHRSHLPSAEVVQLELKKAEGNIRLFLSIKEILGAAVDAVGLDVPGHDGILTRCHVRLGAHIVLLNIRLKQLEVEHRLGSSGEHRLEKASNMLPRIDPDRLLPTADSLAELKAHILDSLPADDWLQTKLRSLQYAGGYSFEGWLN